MPTELPPFPSHGGSYRLNKKGDGWDCTSPTTQPWCAHDQQAAAEEPAAQPEPEPPAPPTDD